MSKDDVTPRTWREEFPQPTGETPDLEDLQEWLDEGGCMATDGECWVEPDGVCKHGYPSWLLWLGLV